MSTFKIYQKGAYDSRSGSESEIDMLESDESLSEEAEIEIIR